MKTLKIKATFSTLAEAVAASTIDLSYNPAEAARTIHNNDTGFGRDQGTTAAFLTEDGEVWFIYRADIALLHQFDPFCGCLTDSPFVLAKLEATQIVPLNVTLPKTRAGRQAVAEIQAINPLLLAC